MTAFLFVGFLNVRITGKAASRPLCTVAPLTLGVYLIHAHANVSPWSWDVLALPSKMTSGAFPLVQLASVLGIFIVCAVIDAIRKVTVGKIENSRIISTACSQTQEKLNALLSKVL